VDAPERPVKKPRSAAAATAGGSSGSGAGTGAYHPIGRHESVERQEAHARELYAQALALLTGSESALWSGC